jgi:hypothetical protein
MFLAINFAALNNLLQMFSNNMNLNGNKPPLLSAPNPSSNMNLSSQHGSNQSLNIQEQHTRLSNQNNTSYNNESSLLMCGPNPNSPPNTHHNQNSGLTPSIATASNGPYPSAVPSLYANSASPLSNNGAGE